MAEKVETGGLMSFNYENNHNHDDDTVHFVLDHKRKKALEKGYIEYHERKEKERKTKKLFWTILVIILILSGIIFFTLR